jgi:hypothetical protein
VAYRAGKLPKELPAWFTQLDTNQDAQISLFEWRASNRSLQEFAKIDRNDDGFLTVDEVLRYEAAQGRTQQNLAGVGGTPGMPFGMAGLAPGASGMQVPMTATPGMAWPGRQPGRGLGGDRGGRGPRGQDANAGDSSARPPRGQRGGGKGFPKQGG